MLELSLLLVILPFIIVYFFRRQKQKKCQFLEPPGPPGLPIIGNFHQFLNITTTPQEYLWKLSKKYGPVMSMRFGSVPVLVISSANAAEQALKAQDHAFSGRPTSIAAHRFSYNGLDFAFRSYGQYWKEMKKIAVLHLFSTKRVQSFRHVREDEVSILIREIHEEAANKSSESSSVNMSETVMSFTRSLICRICFGKRVQEKETEKKKGRIFKELFLESQAMFAGIFFSDYFPRFGWPVDKLRGMSGKLEKNVREFDHFYQEIIDEHLKQQEEDTPDSAAEGNNDVLDILLKLRAEKSTPFDLSFDHIKALLMNIIVPGTDSSAATIIWTMTALMQNPTVMVKLREEIRKLVGNKGKVNEDDIQKLPYLKAVLMEVLRLYPPVPLLVPRATLEKCNIDSYEIQPKTMVYFNAWAISRDPEYWENPNEFMPQRFLREDYSISCSYEVQNFAFLPFGGGRRTCPGLNLGMAMVELAIANLIFAFDWELLPGMKKEDIDLDVCPGITMHKKNDLLLVPKRYV